MKKLTLSFVMILLSVWAVNAQTIPPDATSFLNKFYKVWKPAPGVCENRKWFLTGDFDGDGMKDHLVRVTTGKTASAARLNLVVFINAAGGLYRAQQLLDDPLKGDLLRSSFSVIKKGTMIQLGEGDGPTITLENDAASQYICQTDAIKTMIFKDGAWKNIYDQ
jgi:hypothetical protein